MLSADDYLADGVALTLDVHAAHCGIHDTYALEVVILDRSVVVADDCVNARCVGKLNDRQLVVTVAVAEECDDVDISNVL